MFKNLQAEFARCNIRPCVGVSKALDCTERTARNKLNGITEITVTEAKKIKLTYFPDLTLDYLFDTSETA